MSITGAPYFAFLTTTRYPRYAAMTVAKAPINAITTVTGKPRILVDGVGVEAGGSDVRVCSGPGNRLIVG